MSYVPVASSGSGARGRLCAGDRNKASGQGEESKALEGGRHDDGVLPRRCNKGVLGSKLCRHRKEVVGLMVKDAVVYILNVPQRAY